ncbi:MAG: hypothetical protein IH888_12915 [Planctomycetes bacterium]|nr:hypothetical protein [Planctomycetota bacterium]
MRLWRTLRGRPGAAGSPRRALEAVRAARARILLEPPTTSTATPVIMEARIEQVRPDDFVISEPLLDGVVRRLVTGEPLRLSFAPDSPVHLEGETQALGRFKISSASETPIYGYRLAIPAKLREVAFRSASRWRIGLDMAREVELYPHDQEVPIRGVVQSVGLSGMQVRVHKLRPRLLRDQRVRLVTYLPSPVGEVNRMVSIKRVRSDPSSRMRVVSLRFDRSLPGLGELLEEVKRKRSGFRKAS